jgi:hypothetical protein
MKSFISFTLLVGFIVGFFSVVSDNLPYMDGNVHVFQIIISYTAIMINSLPIWFVMAMVTGYVFGKNLKHSVLVGMIYTLVAITFYFMMGYGYEFFVYKNQLNELFSFKEQVNILLVWYGASLFGGSIGGGTGFLLKKHPLVLWIVIAGLCLQLYLNGSRSWNDIVGILQNLTYCFMIVSIVSFIIIKKKKPTK